MLVLTRKRTEEIHIGENIRIKVIRCGPNVVKLGIEAPDDVRILRAELTIDPAPTAKGEEEPVGAAVASSGEEVEEECEMAEGEDTETGRRLPEIDAEDLAHFARLIYPQAV